MKVPFFYSVDGEDRRENSLFDFFFDADAWIRFVTVQQGEETRKTSIRNMPGMKECWRYKWLA